MTCMLTMVEGLWRRYSIIQRTQKQFRFEEGRSDRLRKVTGKLRRSLIAHLQTVSATLILSSTSQNESPRCAKFLQATRLHTCKLVQPSLSCDRHTLECHEHSQKSASAENTVTRYSISPVEDCIFMLPIDIMYYDRVYPYGVHGYLGKLHRSDYIGLLWLWIGFSGLHCIIRDRFGKVLQLQQVFLAAKGSLYLKNRRE